MTAKMKGAPVRAEDKVSVSCTITDELKLALRTYAIKEGLRETQVIRFALAEYLKSKGAL